MKKAIITAVKFVTFFIGWALCAYIFEIPTDHPALWRFGAELIPLLSIILFSVIFWLVEKRKITIAPIGKPIKSLEAGVCIGLVWIGSAIGILYLAGVIRFSGRNLVDNFWLWTISCLFNVIMQELLVRGYLYQLLKKNYNVITAAIITTILFTLCHGGALEAGIIPVLNIVTMSIFVTLTLEYFQSIIAPIMIHFVWNYVCAMILNCDSLADDYPSLLQAVYTGNEILSGGVYKMAGSIVVLVLNIFFIVAFGIMLRKQAVE